MRVATMDRYITAIETIVATADAEATVIAGRPGYGANSPAVCLVTARVSEDGAYLNGCHLINWKCGLTFHDRINEAHVRD
jgi:hypothetical protein